MESINRDFDQWVKSQMDKIHEVPDVQFSEDEVWNKVNKGLSLKGGLGSAIPFSLLILGALGLFLWNFYGDLHEESVVKRINNTERKLYIIPKGIQPNTEKLILQGTLPYKRATTFSKRMIRITEEQKVPVQPLDPVSIMDIQTNTTKQTLIHTEEFVKNIELPVSVNVYRPGRYVGSALVFKLEANGVMISKVKNKSISKVVLPVGKTYFNVGKQNLEIDLESGKNYYLRVTYKGFPFGRLHLDWIEESKAKAELEMFNIDMK